MNQVKTGKLIAKLRKEKELTQSQLGEMVGVGDRAVSKWERGIHLPNISIINELSTILGISAQELLDGEINDSSSEPESIDEIKEPESTDSNSPPEPIPPKKFNIKKLLIPFIIIIILIGSLFYYNYTKTSTYILRCDSTEYDVFGKVSFNKNTISVTIDKIVFYDKDLNRTLVKNYEYTLINDTDYLFHQGYLYEHNMLDNEISIEQLLNNLTIQFTNYLEIDKQEIISTGIVLKMSFHQNNDKLLNRDILIKLVKDDKK